MGSAPFDMLGDVLLGLFAFEKHLLVETFNLGVIGGGRVGSRVKGGEYIGGSTRYSSSTGPGPSSTL